MIYHRRSAIPGCKSRVTTAVLAAGDVPLLERAVMGWRATSRYFYLEQN
jgi:hypothetical protein